MTRAALDRVRVSAGIAALAHQQIEDELTADTLDAPQLAAIPRELHHKADPADGLLGALAQLLTVAARRAEDLQPDRDGDAFCPLHEATAYVTDSAGTRIHRATRALEAPARRREDSEGAAS